MPRSTVSSGWTIKRFLGRLSSSEPTPGGGSAAALAGALGCSLGCMVGKILLSRPRLKTAARSRLERNLDLLDGLLEKLQSYIQQDAQAYRALVQAQRSRRGVPMARKRAIECPVKICETTGEALKVIRRISPLAGPYLGSDLKAGRALLKGAFESAYATAVINMEGPDPNGQGVVLRRHLVKLQKGVRSL